MEITRCPDYKFLISTVEKLNKEHLRMSAIMRKIKEMIRLRKSESNLSDNCEVKRSRGSTAFVTPTAITLQQRRLLTRTADWKHDALATN